MRSTRARPHAAGEVPGDKGARGFAMSKVWIPGFEPVVDQRSGARAQHLFKG
jgi:hypothetical protein